MGCSGKSYRLRDEDNIYLGKIEANVAEAEKEGLKRLGLGHDFSRTEILKALRDPNYIPLKDIEPEKPEKSYLYSFKSTF